MHQHRFSWRQRSRNRSTNISPEARRQAMALLAASALLIALVACGGDPAAPTAHTTRRATPTLAPTFTATATSTPTWTPTSTPTPRPTYPPTNLPPPPHGPTATPTPLPPTATPTASGTGTPTPPGGTSTPTLPTATPTPSCPTYSGPGASMAQVKAALTTAAGTPFWPDQPSITVPAHLLFALAWQESGWQSTIIACDGGIGVMQIMPATATWMNQRFGTAFDVNMLSGNADLGAEYVEWLIRYFGDVYYNSNYDLSNQNLLDDIIAAYNVGPANVDPGAGQSGIPNWQYVNDVEALMTSCPCLSF